MNAKLPCVVLATKNPKPDLHFAHIRIGEVFADCPCDPDVMPGDAKLRITFRDYQGRLQSYMRVVSL